MIDIGRYEGGLKHVTYWVPFSNVTLVAGENQRYVWGVIYGGFGNDFSKVTFVSDDRFDWSLCFRYGIVYCTIGELW